ncbi:MAG: hypothetical protein ABSG43_14545 [Solirubrobacteraceae bacterium]|jgi:type IV secretory pathway VirB4 component
MRTRTARLRVTHRACTTDAQALYPHVVQRGLGHQGMRFGTNLLTGAPFIYDPWTLYETGQLHDPCLLTIGAKDAGKSANLKSQVIRQRYFGRRAEIIERKGEYASTVDALDGETIRLEPGHSLNPLERCGTRESRVSMLCAVVRAQLRRDISPEEENGLAAALRAVDERHSDREVVIPDVVAELEAPSQTVADVLRLKRADCQAAMRDCLMALVKLQEGTLAGLFDRPTSVGAGAWDNPVVCLDISRIGRYMHARDESLALGTAVIACTAFLDARRQQRRENGDRQHAERIVDEAWKVLSVEGVPEYLTDRVKVSRDLGDAWLLAFHKLADLSAAGVEGSIAKRLAEGLISECATRVLYRQEPSEIPRTAELLDLSRTEQQLLARLGQGVALWHVGRRRFLVKHLLTRVDRPLINTNEGMAAW